MHAKTDSVVHARNQLSCARGCWCPYDGDDSDGDNDDDDDDDEEEEEDDDDDDDSKKDDKVAVPVCAQEHERYYPNPPHPPHPTPPHQKQRSPWQEFSKRFVQIGDGLTPNNYADINDNGNNNNSCSNDGAVKWSYPLAE